MSQPLDVLTKSEKKSIKEEVICQQIESIQSKNTVCIDLSTTCLNCQVTRALDNDDDKSITITKLVEIVTKKLRRDCEPWWQSIRSYVGINSDCNLCANKACQARGTAYAVLHKAAVKYNKRGKPDAKVKPLVPAFKTKRQ